MLGYIHTRFIQTFFMLPAESLLIFIQDNTVRTDSDRYGLSFNYYINRPVFLSQLETVVFLSQL